MPDPADLTPAPLIEGRILLIRGEKVLLDADLAELYGVPTKAFNQAVTRLSNGTGHAFRTTSCFS